MQKNNERGIAMIMIYDNDVADYPTTWNLGGKYEGVPYNPETMIICFENKWIGGDFYHFTSDDITYYIYFTQTLHIFNDTVKNMVIFNLIFEKNDDDYIKYLNSKSNFKDNDLSIDYLKSNLNEWLPKIAKDMKANATKVWTSNIPANFSDGTAWGGSAPLAGDAISFSSGTGTCTVDSVAGNFSTMLISVNVIITMNADMTFTSTWTQTTGTLTPNAQTLIIQGATNISNSGVFGGDTAWTFYSGAFTCSSTFNAPNGSSAIGFLLYGNLTLSGAFSHNSGTIQPTTYNIIIINNSASSFYNIYFSSTGKVVTQGSDITITRQLSINVGTWDTSSSGNYALTVTGNSSTNYVVVSTNAILNTNNSTCIFGSGQTYKFSIYGTFNGGTGAHTYGCLSIDGASANVTLTTGNTIIDYVNDTSGALGAKCALIWNAAGTLTHAGTILFTRNGTQLLYHVNNTAQQLYNVTANGGASQTVQFYNAKGFNLTVNNLTCTNGTLNTSETVTGTSKNITVNALTLIDGGILIPNISVILHSGAVTITSGTYGGVTAYTSTFSSTLTASGGNFISPKTWNQAGDCDLTGTAYTSNSESYIVSGSHVLNSDDNTISTVQFSSNYILTISTKLTATNFIMITDGKLYGSIEAIELEVTNLTWESCNIKWIEFDNDVIIDAYITLDGDCYSNNWTTSTDGSTIISSYILEVALYTNQDNGITTFTTGKLIANDGVNLDGGSFGSDSAYTLDCNSMFTVTGTPTLTAPRWWNQTDNCTLVSGMIYLSNTETYTVCDDHILDTDGKTINIVLYNEAGITLTIASANTIITTLTMSSNCKLYGSAKYKTLTVTNMQWESCNIRWIEFNNDVITDTNTITLDGDCYSSNWTTSLSGSTIIASYTLEVALYTNQDNGITTFTTGKLIANDGVNLDGGSFGSAAVYTLDCKSKFTVTGTPTLIAPSLWNQYDDCTLVSGMIYTSNSETYTIYDSHILDSAGQTINTIQYNADYTLTIVDTSELTVNTFQFSTNSKLYGISASSTLNATNVIFTTCNIKFVNINSVLSTPDTGIIITVDDETYFMQSFQLSANDTVSISIYDLDILGTTDLDGTITIGDTNINGLSFGDTVASSGNITTSSGSNVNATGIVMSGGVIGTDTEWYCNVTALTILDGIFQIGINGIMDGSGTIAVHKSFILNGTSGNEIIIGSIIRYQKILFYDGAIVSMSYVNISTHANIDEIGVSFSTGSITHTIDHCIFNDDNSGAFGSISYTGKITVTYCQFTGLNGAWNQEDIACCTNCQIQLNNCIYGTVGFEGTSGWISSKNAQTTAFETAIYGIINSNSPDASYQIEATDSVSTHNAEVYGSSFNTLLVITGSDVISTYMEVYELTTVDITAGRILTSDEYDIKGNITVVDTSYLACNTLITVELNGILGSNNKAWNISAEEILVEINATIQCPNLTGYFELYGGDFSKSCTIQGTIVHNSGTITTTGSLLMDTESSTGNFYNLQINGSGISVGQASVNTFDGNIEIIDGNIYTNDGSGNVYDLNANGIIVGTNVPATAAGVEGDNNVTITTTYVDIQGNGVYVASEYTIILDSNTSNISWNRLGIFDNNNGIVRFTGCTTPYKIMGSSDWFGLEIIVSSSTNYQFEGGSLQTVSDHCYMYANIGFVLTLDSTDGNQWRIDLDASTNQNFARLNVSNSDASLGDTCYAAFSLDIGGNNNWYFGSVIGEYIWNGLGADNFATTNENWEGGLAPPSVSYYDSTGQLSNWSLYGVTAKYSDNGKLYWSLSNVGTIRTINLYKDGLGSVLIASGSRNGDGNIILNSSSSMVSASVDVVYTADVPISIDNIVMNTNITLGNASNKKMIYDISYPIGTLYTTAGFVGDYVTTGIIQISNNSILYSIEMIDGRLNIDNYSIELFRSLIISKPANIINLQEILLYDCLLLYINVDSIDRISTEQGSSLYSDDLHNQVQRKDVLLSTHVKWYNYCLNNSKKYNRGKLI